MKRAKPDAVDRDLTYGPALYWRPNHRCPQQCEYRGDGHHPGEWHIEYRRTGDRARPIPMLRLVKR